ncbi:helix-turn-helix domain-containing protein [Maribacter sp. 2304DJ31-5]|uniref:helix-turn-helix domain-containing protein n=1 Tax=Maribacter sp. 2304DJ31-5 TaxID=3386273 RepID=UPI0039BC28A1
MSHPTVTPFPIINSRLRPFIKRICLVENTLASPLTQQVPPIGAIGLTFILKKGIELYIDGQNIPLNKRSYIIGHVTREGISVIHEGEVAQMVIDFTPTGFYRMFKKNCRTFNNRLGDFSEIDAKPLEVALENSSYDHKEIHKIFEDYLSSKIESALPEVPFVEEALALMHQNLLENHRIEDISNKVGIGQRHLSRMFTKTVGISPKKFFRTLQWNHIMTIISMNQKDSMTKLALACGFYDQPSFTNEFKRFMQIPPRKFINGRLQLAQLMLKE